MTYFIDLRVQPIGGPLAATPMLYQGSSAANYSSADVSGFAAAVRGRNVLVGTHGFNVDREKGIVDLDSWSQLLLELDPTTDLFVGVLWPGDSVWAHGLDYPGEPRIADDAGECLGLFLSQHLAGAASVSFSSHSLGARLVLHTVLRMTLPVRKVILMAGAINDDCLTGEFANATSRIGEISVLSSKSDVVLAALFPLGNPLSGILDVGHPWWHGALGRSGPQRPWPSNFQAPFQIPDGWGYGHDDYLQIDPAAAAAVPMRVDVPADGTEAPANGEPGWQQTFSAAFVSTRFKS
jgi:hypothetical protein